MSLGVGFRNLASLVETLESEGAAVTAADIDELITEDTITVTLQMEISCTDLFDNRKRDTPQEETAERADGSEIESASSTDLYADSVSQSDADTSADGETDESVAEDHSTSEEADAVTTDSESGSTDTSQDDVITCTSCDKTFETKRGMKIHRTHVHGLIDTATPAYRDPDALREVYAKHDTFAAMADALDSDVTATTVRRYLIEHGIHESSSRSDAATDDSSDSTKTEADSTATSRMQSKADSDTDVTADPETDATIDSEADAMADSEPDTVADSDSNSISESGAISESGSGVSGPPTELDELAAIANDPDRLADLSLDIDIPDGLTPADIHDAVKGARTVYEVQRDLDLDQEQTMSLLTELDLLDLVHGRLSTARTRQRAKDEIGDRLLRHLDGASA